MRPLADIPIKQKLMVIILVTVAVAGILSGAGMLISDFLLFRAYLQRDLSALAQLVAYDNSAALLFNDPQYSTQSLGALRAKSHVVAACIYRADQTVLARYSREGSVAICPAPMESDSIQITAAGMAVSRAVINDGRRLGTLVLLYDQEELSTRAQVYGGIVLLVLVISGFLAVLLASGLRQALTTPILNLASTARAVSDAKDYSLRASKVSNDELGELSDAFNAMLGNIQTREAELRQSRDEMEQRVLRRTEELRLSEERIRLLIDRAQDYAIFMLDPGGHIATWNEGAQRIKGYTAAEIIGKHFSTFYPQDDIDAGKPEWELKTALAEGRVEDEDWRLRKDGTRFWANVVITALRDSQGNVLGFSKITRDLTERKRAEEAVKFQAAELARSNADLQQFAYVASHDLQEPLRMVISYLQIIADRYKGQLDADADEFIGYAVDGGLRMRQLINDLLEYSRVGRRGAEAAETVADCGTILENVQANLALAIRESQAVIVTDPDRLPTVKADPAYLSQLFQNLISNALKFRGSAPPRIVISVKPTAGPHATYWLCSVKDNGIGIDPEYRQVIFDIFRRLHDRTEYPGTGMGLAICKKLAERLGGRIWVESETGKGATFFFTIGEKRPNII